MFLYTRSTIQVLCLHLVMLYLELSTLLSAHGFSMRYKITTRYIEKLWREAIDLSPFYGEHEKFF